MADERGRVRLVNPLPLTMHHFETELRSVLRAATDRDVESAGTASGEFAAEGLGRAHKARAAAGLAATPLRVRRGPRAALTVVIWPIFGLSEPMLWSVLARREPVAVIVHDPAPLRPMPGMGRLARQLGRLAHNRARVDVVVHSESARSQLRDWGWNRTVLLPHPVLVGPDALPPAAAVQPRAAVVGQFKPARDLDLLTKLADPLRAAGLTPAIFGPGWPSVAGWDTTSRRLREDDLSAAIASSAVVLIPYKRFYQSGIAIRALELGVPVSGPRHDFLTELYGTDWAGWTDTQDAHEWANAALAAAGERAAVAGRYRSYADRTVAAWRSYVEAAAR